MLYIGVMKGKKLTQAEFAHLCRTHPVTLGKWTREQEITRNTCLTIADALERYFAAEGVRVTPDDVAGPDLVGKIREQLEEQAGAGKPAAGTGYSERNLRKLLDDEGVVRLLGIDGPLREWLLKMVPKMRADLTDQDWAEVVRIVKAGLWEVEGYLFMDPDVISVRMHFKSPRVITDAEKRKLQLVLQRELDKLWADKHNPGA